MNKSESKYFNTAAKMDLALIELLKKKSFAYITVSEICKTAGVNRSTFYLHYETIGDLLTETVRYLLNDFFSYFSPTKINPSDCELDELIFICDKYLTPYLTYIKDHKEVFLTALLNNKALGFDSVYQNLFDHIFNPILDRFQYPPNYRQYVMMYYLSGVNAIILEWLKTDCAQPMRDIAEIICACIFGLEHTLGNSS